MRGRFLTSLQCGWTPTRATASVLRADRMTRWSRGSRRKEAGAIMVGPVALGATAPRCLSSRPWAQEGHDRVEGGHDDRTSRHYDSRLEDC